MKLENTCVVQLPRQRLWDFLIVIPNVAECLPGVEEVIEIDKQNYEGAIRVNALHEPIDLPAQPHLLRAPEELPRALEVIGPDTTHARLKQRVLPFVRVSRLEHGSKDRRKCLPILSPASGIIESTVLAQVRPL